VGAGPGIIETNSAKECETDLVRRNRLFCVVASSKLIPAALNNTWSKAATSPKCDISNRLRHETKLIVDLILLERRHRLTWHIMSNLRTPRNTPVRYPVRAVLSYDETKAAYEAVLSDIQSGKVRYGDFIAGRNVCLGQATLKSSQSRQ